MGMLSVFCTLFIGLSPSDMRLRARSYRPRPTMFQWINTTTFAQKIVPFPSTETPADP
jgi:hypothetical protein